MLAFLPLHGYTGRHRRGVQLEPEGSVDGGSYVLSAAEEIAPRWNCTGTFVDAGANNGDTLRSWYTDESCAIAPHQLRGKPCAWQWPWWLQLKERQKYCAKAYEPNSRLSHPLHHAAFILRHQLGVHIEVFNGTAFGEADGTAVFGIDQTSGNAEGSSLMLHKRTKTLTGGVGTGPEVGENRMTVRTVDALRVLREAPPGPIALKIDVEVCIASGLLAVRSSDGMGAFADGGAAADGLGTSIEIPPPSLIFSGMHKTLPSLMSAPTLDSIN